MQSLILLIYLRNFEFKDLVFQKQQRSTYLLNQCSFDLFLKGRQLMIALK